MPTTPITPYVPQSITVHLGPPGADAENVTVSFPDYVKNVASSEIYPTWEPAAIRANVLAIISFALNRVYTEYYPSRGYPFNITSSTAYDQKFIKGRSIFEFVEPLAAKFCNGTTTTCDGLSQWGSQAMAEQGADSITILRSYYGDNIEIVTNAPVMGIRYSYPGAPVRLGDRGEAVLRIQTMLNRISRDYPAIPKVQPVDGIFGEGTEQAVIKFQQIFSLTPDGIVGSATWYKLVFLYVGVLDLAELVSEGQTFYANAIPLEFSDVVAPGDTGEEVRVIQYLLSVVSEFYSTPLRRHRGHHDRVHQRDPRAVPPPAGGERRHQPDPIPRPPPDPGQHGRIRRPTHDPHRHPLHRPAGAQPADHAAHPLLCLPLPPPGHPGRDLRGAHPGGGDAPPAGILSPGHRPGGSGHLGRYHGPLPPGGAPAVRPPARHHRPRG